jgi:hypothetical protein
MNLKQLAGKVREAVKGDEPFASPPASPAKPFDWDSPAPATFDSMRPSKPVTEAAPRPEPRPSPTREPAVREAAPRSAAPKPEIGRTSDVRLGPPPENAEAAGRAGRWKASATVPDLGNVYKEAGIESPLHGYGVDKLTDMLASPHLANATRDVRATAVQVALEAARIPLRDIIDDALLRSKALAAFEADKAFDLQASQMRAERRAQVLRDQVDAFRRQKDTEIGELKRTIDAADQALSQLRARKRREEERLHRIVTHFVEPRPAVAAAPVAARPATPAPTPPPARVPAPASASPSTPAASAAAPTVIVSPSSNPTATPVTGAPSGPPAPGADTKSTSPDRPPATTAAGGASTSASATGAASPSNPAGPPAEDATPTGSSKARS